MSEEQLKAFLEAVKADAGLQERLKTAKDVDAVLEIAKAAGFVISADELQRDPKTELSDEELEELTGGASPAVVGVVASILYCVAGGALIYDALGGD